MSDDNPIMSPYTTIGMGDLLYPDDGYGDENAYGDSDY